jgi:raffinose/stachyose/melibiose transport system permease protein
MTRTGIARTFYLMALPAFALFFVFHTVPLIAGVFYSFTNYRGFGDFEFVGLANYLALFSDRRIRDSYLFTFQFAIVGTILLNIIALAIAVGLNSNIRFRNALRGIFFVPYVLSILIVGFIFSYIFAFLLPDLGQWAGIARLSANLLSDPSLAWVGVVVVAVWQAVAFSIVLYLSGLQTVPVEQLEAAELDGAGKWRSFWSVTFPLIAPFFTINMVLGMKGFLMTFDLVVALTNGGPGTATETVSLVIYRGGFEGGEFAYQSANAVVFLVVLVIVAAIQFRYLNRREVQV